MFDELMQIATTANRPALLEGNHAFWLSDILEAREAVDLHDIHAGDVVALIGDFSVVSVGLMLRLFELGAVVVPLSAASRPQHDYFFEAAEVDVVVERDRVERRKAAQTPHVLLEQLRKSGHAGLVLFSSGTTGLPKAILHDFETFLARYRTPRPAFRTLTFLFFDHIGGINTLFHTLFNSGQIVIPSSHTVDGILGDICRHAVELLPTSPTFLRMMLMSDLLTPEATASLKVISYGTERMDQTTLTAICSKLPLVDFRQTYGMSELGILRVRSESRDSLWMAVGGEGVETRIVDDVLQIKATNCMLGYLNAPSPFLNEWYDTGDLVEEKAGKIRIVGRTNQVINVGGVKILPSVVEQAALSMPKVLRCWAHGARNPILGEHIEVICQPRENETLTRQELRDHFRQTLPSTVQPHRIVIGEVGISHRFKQIPQ